MTRHLLRLAGGPSLRCFAWLITCAIAVMGWLAVVIPVCGPPFFGPVSVRVPSTTASRGRGVEVSGRLDR